MTTTVSCVGGGRVHTSGFPKTPAAEFEVPEDCKMLTQAKVPAADAAFFMIHGRTAYSLLVLDKKGAGVEIENYWKDEAGHHFVGVTPNGPGWHYSIPDKRGANGQIQSYTKYTVIAADDHNVLKGDVVETCALNFLAAEPQQDDAPVEPGPAAAACQVGETRECVGAGACRGGQMCLQDRSGFATCDCGGVAAPPPPDGTPPGGSTEAAPVPGSTP